MLSSSFPSFSVDQRLIQFYQDKQAKIAIAECIVYYYNQTMCTPRKNTFPLLKDKRSASSSSLVLLIEEKEGLIRHQMMKLGGGAIETQSLRTMDSSGSSFDNNVEEVLQYSCVQKQPKEDVVEAANCIVHSAEHGTGFAPEKDQPPSTSNKAKSPQEEPLTIPESKFSDHFNCSHEKNKRDSLSGVLSNIDHPSPATLAVLAPVGASCSDKASSSHSPLWNNQATSKVFASELRNKARCRFSNGHFNDDLENVLSVMMKAHRSEKQNTVVTATEEEGTREEDYGHNLITVRFSVVTIQEYSIQPGDNPGGNSGCPLTIGWDPLSEPVTLGLDAYEEVRHFNRRLPHEMELVSSHRQDLLLRMGYSAREVLAATKAANTIRRNRCKTIASLKSSAAEERMEALRRYFHNLMTLGGAKRQEREFLAPFKKTKIV
jgi:hypothetical protein